MGNMLKTIGKRARLARGCESGSALGITLGVMLSVLVATIRDSRGGGRRTVRMAKFARPTTVPFPPENPYSPEKAELGRKLFFDPLMSPSGTISCATCHHPRLAWSDGLPRAAQASSPVIPAR